MRSIDRSRVKVLGIVGSPRKAGNTEIMLKEALKAAQEAGAEVELLRLAEKKIRPCDGCLSCGVTGKCKIDDDLMAVFKKMTEADGIIIASPVYFGSITPETKALIDRAGFYNREAHQRSAFTGKLGGALVVARRWGGLTSFHQIIQFFLNQRMIVSGLSGWGVGIGEHPGEVLKDKEGMDRARELGNVMTSLAMKLQSK